MNYLVIFIINIYISSFLMIQNRTHLGDLRMIGILMKSEFLCPQLNGCPITLFIFINCLVSYLFLLFKGFFYILQL
jgi:hypothetical protein